MSDVQLHLGSMTHAKISISFLSLSIALMELFSTNFNSFPFVRDTWYSGHSSVKFTMPDLCDCWSKARLVLLTEILWFTVVGLNLHKRAHTEVQLQVCESSLEDGNSLWLSQSMDSSNCALPFLTAQVM